MDRNLVTALVADLCERADYPKPTEREEVRVWSLSGVERIRFFDGRSLIFKFAAEPFTDEHRALDFARAHGIPVPQLYAAIQRDHMLGMLMEDLGTPIREATDRDGVHAALVIHAAGRAGTMPQLDQHTLSRLPNLAASHLKRLQEQGRWLDVGDVAEGISILQEAASSRAVGAELAPFGLVHSEFHPTSLHVGAGGWRLLDFARAFTGPGLLDLASWHGTIDAADPDRLRGFLETYVAAGGNENTLAKRGGLAAEAWALGWHRVWAIEWFLEQSVRWINNPESDLVYIVAIRRHLDEATRLMEV
ncbi:phosphotransferase [Catenulispora sp. NL8]|uniref:Phosphotransferase n=1 Tax=Catenulispora pinistramenti TaxID=2705254 RepID=A0ABS5L4Z8_9ACTN|nr:phosphotransferase [Catenulispora pinistramenti]MBS2553421.1 phosphotransferase [Catenulispora pinistramenti]